MRSTGVVLLTVVVLLLVAILSLWPERSSPGFTYLREESFSCGGMTNTVEIYRHDLTGLEFVQVPGGAFIMGKPRGEGFRAPQGNEKAPRHRVTIKPFLICRTEVTQSVWDALSGADERRFENSPETPIEGVSWFDVTEWCQRAGLRLPTEAEWEYACRAGTDTLYSFGDDDGQVSDYAWIADNSQGTPQPPGRKNPNAFGLFDMHGNLWEWCQDWYKEDYVGTPVDGSAYEEGGGTMRVYRGGGFSRDDKYCRAGNRYRCAPDTRHFMLGFRPAF